ncbi:MAG: hypothetical protein GEU26_17275 [Nitrososphaeraceae archaeon]|jgi:hypothetical protein|nr:hypothetical protein [Nitrososphaeraceae archaeon]
MPPFRFDILLFRGIADAIDETEIKAAVGKIRLYETGDGYEAEIPSVSDSTNTWFACRYLPAITGPTEDPIWKIKRFIPNDIPLNCFGVEISTTFTEPICINANPTATKTRTAATAAFVE